MTYRSVVVLFFSLFFLQIPFQSNAGEVYLSTELGVGVGRSLDTRSLDNDSPTLCDNHLDPLNLFSPKGVNEAAGECPVGDSWNSSFDRSTGIIAGAALGYKTAAGPRIEAEFLNFGTKYSSGFSDASATGSDLQDKTQQELVRADERIGEVHINSLFVNVYYDFRTFGKIRPYIGAGAGFGMARVEYDSIWARNLNPEAIKTADPENADYNGQNPANEAADRETVVRRIAGTTTSATATLEDTIPGYQVLIGADYMLTERTSLGIKGRWVQYGEFKDGNPWDQLRSHAPNNGPGTPTVEYRIETEDLSAFGISLVMKYAF